MLLFEDTTLATDADDTKRQDSVQFKSIEAQRIKCEEDRGLVEGNIPN